MCGICGYLIFDSSLNFDENVISQMNEAIFHRGPDEDGIFIDKNIALGVRRLSIIDLLGGHQPIFNEDKKICLVFNGEIYNFLELRKILEQKNHQFYTKTDSEVIVHLYEDYEEVCLKYLNGMFSFALWDKSKERLFLARDRMGKKPLHYVFSDKFFIFASEIKSILKHPSIERRVDLSSLNKYLTLEYIPAPNTIFQDIKKLLPGHYLICENNKIFIKKYWDISFSPGKNRVKSEDEYADELKERLRESVKRRLISDVPLGVFLSGGIDSSSIVALMSEFIPGEVKTFTIGFDDPSFDESSYAREVAKIFQTQHFEEILQPSQLLDLVPKVVDFLDEPLADASIIPTYLLSKFTRQNVKVALGGDGGDELFAGYPTYQAHRLAGFYKKLPSFIRDKIIYQLVQRLPVSMNDISFDFRVKKFVSGIDYQPEIRNYLWLGSFTPEQKELLFSDDIKEYLDGENTFEDIENYLASCDAEDPLHKLLYLDAKLYLQDDILVKTDRASMACSLEVRAPFLDYKFVEFVARLPHQFKLNKLTTKYIFKKSMGKILPEKIIKRKKKGFGIPVAKWVRGELKPLVLEVFNKDKIDREGFFNCHAIEEILNEHFAGKKDNRKLIWTLLIFELWYDRYMKGSND